MTAALLGSMCGFTAEAVEFGGVVGVGYDFGGDVMASGLYEDGSEWELKANQGPQLKVGGVMVTGLFETQLTIAYKSSGIKHGAESPITLDLVPIELMEFYRAGNFRIGLGVMYLNNPKLVIDIPTVNQNTYQFESVVGNVAEIGWVLDEEPVSFGFRYTSASFKEKLPNAEAIKGNSVGVFVEYFF